MLRLLDSLPSGNGYKCRLTFDPRELPSGFPQAIGHIRDNKCRQLIPRHPPPLHCTSKRVMSGT